MGLCAICFWCKKLAFNIAIFGGSFDPPHLGHKEIIEKLLNLDFLDLIIVLPTFLNPLKDKTLIPPKDRILLLDKMIERNQKILISDYEIRQNKVTYTIDSILYFKKIYKPDSIYLVIGADILKDLDKWYKIEEIINQTKLIIAKRNNIKIESSKFYNKDKTIILNTNNKNSSTKIRKKYFANFKDSKIESKI